ncbi:hypothetical protein PHYSODRAFT_472926, partial [Phytophthora sojae]
PFVLKGTASMMIIDDVADVMRNVFAGLHFVVELTKDRCEVEERAKILIELVAADLKSEVRCAPVGLLTNLNDYWYFLWLTPDREIARMMLTSPANGFKMIREVLTHSSEGSDGVFPMQISFLPSPLLKRQKMLNAALAGEDPAAEMLERYELMSDELSPEFLQERKMEYASQMIRNMPVYSGMFLEELVCDQLCNRKTSFAKSST